MAARIFRCECDPVSVPPHPVSFSGDLRERWAVSPPWIQIQGVARGDRHGFTSFASDAIVASGGYVMDYRAFSNLAVCFTLEIPAKGLLVLRERLRIGGIELEPPAPAEEIATECGETAVSGTLRLDFRHEEPDMRIPIPAVPG
jgi:hypothetical protein